MKILITGGAGFIGSYLTEHHIQKGDEVCVLDNLSNGTLANLSNIANKPGFKLIEADILTYKGLEDCVRWADRIYHMASAVGMFYLIEHPLITMRTNILGCERLLHCMSLVNSKAPVLIASSSEIYGPDAVCPLKEDSRFVFESTPNGKWFYASSKYSSEMISLAYVKAAHLNITLARLFNTIGPRQNAQYGSVVPRFIKAAMAGEPITIFGDGEQTRCFCDVRDIVMALDLLVSNPHSVGEVVNIGQDKMVSINRLADLIKRLTKSASKLTYIPYEKAYGEAYEDIIHRQPDLHKYLKFVPYAFQWDLESSLKHQIELATLEKK